jgi:hypothetical protein
VTSWKHPLGNFNLNQLRRLMFNFKGGIDK